MISVFGKQILLAFISSTKLNQAVCNEHLALGWVGVFLYLCLGVWLVFF